MWVDATVKGLLETGAQHLQTKFDEYPDLCGRLGFQPAADAMAPAKAKIMRGLVTLTDECLAPKYLNEPEQQNV